MKIAPFAMERMQSTWENEVEIDLSESGVRPVTLRELVELGFDLDAAMDMPLGYSQSNGTPPLKKLLAAHYPGAGADNLQVTNGTSEANYILSLALIRPGDETAIALPNYMQLWELPRSLGATVNSFRLRPERDWEPDWAEFERAVNRNTRILYLSHPGNPTGSILPLESMKRIAARCDETGTMLLADEVYLGAELSGPRTPSFWGLGKNVVVTSGLSKAYGIPGIRIGWIAGPAGLLQETWTQHDYITIGPNKLSDLIARTAVLPEVREKLYARTRRILSENVSIIREWARGFGSFFTVIEPRAGAMYLLDYKADISSYDLAERVRKNRSVLIVPGSHFGQEGCIRIWFGASEPKLREGLRRVAEELRALPGFPKGA